MYLSNNHIPTLDLHGNPRDIARVLVNDFIYDSYKQKIEKVIIIHGIGQGILKEEVKKTLKNNKYVDSFKIDNFNVGETIVKIKEVK